MFVMNHHGLTKMNRGPQEVLASKIRARLRQQINEKPNKHIRRSEKSNNIVGPR